MHPSKLLLVIALPQESRGLLERAGARVLYTGVGKINAAASLARRLAEMRCRGEPTPLVVNMGTAGSRSIPPHTLVAPTRFSQRDMDVSGMGIPPGVTPFDATPPVLETPRVFERLPAVLCSTADSFATDRHVVAGDVVDMEAFALARVCIDENARFACAKYVTDGADADSASHWEAALDNASRAFLTAYEFLLETP